MESVIAQSSMDRGHNLHVTLFGCDFEVAVDDAVSQLVAGLSML